MKVFVAFPVVGELANEFVEYFKVNESVQNVKWTHPENLHVTLFFIGEIQPEELSHVNEKLSGVFIDQEKFILQYETIESKGRSKPSLIWARFKSENNFSELSDKIYLSVKQFMPNEPSHTDPIPHCTLARIKGKSDLSFLEKEIEIRNRVVEVNCAELWETVQTGEGVRYKSLNRWNLK